MSTLWKVTKALSVAQLRAEGIGSMIHGDCSARPIGSLIDSSRKRAAPIDGDDGSLSPSTDLEASQNHLQDLRSEILELKMEAERAKRLRLEKEKKTDELARQTQQQWAELELTKKELVRQLADEKAKAAAQEVGYLTIMASISHPLTFPILGRAAEFAARLCQRCSCSRIERVEVRPSGPMLSVRMDSDTVDTTKSEFYFRYIDASYQKDGGYGLHMLVCIHHRHLSLTSGCRF